jgi:5-methylcytosine-specific restriction endonuclease McrA
MPKIIRVWPQGWRVPTARNPMTSKEYAAYLDQPHWQQFNKAYRESDSELHECFVCGNVNYDLHHHTYARLGREGLSDVVPLCREHHKSVHKAVKAGVQLSNAHTYVKTRYQRGELGVRSLKTEN